MAKPKEPRVNIGTIGHVGHGKSTLTAAITKVLHDADQNGTRLTSFDAIDKAPELRQRGITFSMSRVEYQTEARSYAHIDCPEHWDYVKAMITGEPQLDMAILVVAATQGPMPQTKEHVLLARQGGIPSIVVALNMSDVMDDEDTLTAVEEEVRYLLNEFGYDGDEAPMVRVSALKALEGDAQWGEKLLGLMKSIDATVPEPKRNVTATAAAHREFEATTYILSKDEGGRHTPFFNNYRPDFDFGTTPATAGVVSLKDGTEMVMPGALADITVQLTESAPMAQGTRFTLSEGGRTIGVGRVERVNS